MTEEPDMAVFVDQTSDAATQELGEVRRRLSTVIAALEEAGVDYHRAWRMLLAGEACIDHAVGQLTAARNARQQAWSHRQSEARDFLELRAEGSGRVFRVTEERRYAAGQKRGFIFTATERLTFTIERAAALDGRRFGAIARVTARGKDGTDYTTDLPLQTLHRAFLDGVIVETDEVLPAKLGPAARSTEFESLGEIARAATEPSPLRLHLEEESKP
jgi:hypothetical protein